MLTRYFVNQGIKEARIEEFIKSRFPLGDYSRIELQRTPLGIKIIIYTNKPGRIIGRGGKNINDITEAIRKEFSLENPQVDVKTIRNPNLDARIVAKQISSALERGYNYKKIGNLTLNRIMESGAVGAEIVISGRISGSKGMIGKFTDGYLKRCGYPAKELVDYGFEEANTKPGKIGIKVKIMKEFEDITGERKRTKEPEEPQKAIIEELGVEKKPKASKEVKKKKKALAKKPGEKKDKKQKKIKIKE